MVSHSWGCSRRCRSPGAGEVNRRPANRRRHPAPSPSRLAHRPTRQRRVPGSCQLLVAGLVPAELDHAARFFDQELHAHGYRLGRGDAEQGEVEAPFTGNGYRGKWQVNSVVECPDTVRLTLVLIRQA